MRFTRLKIGQSETKELTLKNGINEPSIIGAVAKPFSFVSLKEITGEFPVSSTIYFRENYVLQDESGDFATTDQGYGVAGFTDESKKFTPYNYEISFDEIDLTAGEESDITGEHTGGEGHFLNVYSRTSEVGETPAGEWTLFDEDIEVQSDNTWTATGTITTAGTYDFLAVDSVCSACSAQVDDVVVESGGVVVDDFDSYSEGQSVIGNGWFVGSGGGASSVYSGALRLAATSYSNFRIYKPIATNNYIGKKIQIRAKKTASGSFSIFLYLNGVQKEVVANAPTIGTTYTVYEFPITYDGDVNKVHIQHYTPGLFPSYYCDIDFIKII